MHQMQALNVQENQNNCILCVTSPLEHWYIFVLLFWYQSVFTEGIVQFMVDILQEQL